MYQYDSYDQAMVDARVAEFRDQVRRRLDGSLSEEQFKPLRLMNGLYLQLHAYMLRVAVPYGTLSGAQMHALGDIADKYDRGYGHFTTRQNIQYNWIKLEEAADILADLAKVEMHAIQTSGNCIRNTTSDQYAGAIADEITDPRPYAELIRQWSTFHPEFTYLPRKFKMAVIASETDRAAMRLHDIGIQIVKNAAGELGAAFYVGGGMGRTPMIAPLINGFVPIDQMITYSEACLRVYNRYGRRDNKYKARIKILVHELGKDEYTRQVEAEFAHLLSQNIAPPLAELERIKAQFAAPAFETGLPDTVDRSDPDFALWLDNNVHAHKAPGYAVVTISLKPVGGIPGDATGAQMRLMAALAKAHSFDELRVTHAQNIVLPHVRKVDLYGLWQQLDAAGLGAANLDKIGDIIACPGLDYCSLANARSIPVAQKISEKFAAREQEIGELKLKISGCINACGHHHAGHIGILGVDRRGVENYQLLLGGSEGADTSLGTITGPGFSEDGVVAAIETATEVYLANKQGSERFLDTYRRIGMAPFKAAIYAPSPAKQEDRPMVETQLRFRTDESVGDPAVTVDSFGEQTNASAVRIEPGDDARVLLPHLDRIKLVEVNFPVFGDGRGYSAARILREAGYSGELRAVGDVLVDQLAAMRRCGFDSFAPDHPLNDADAQAALLRYDQVYTPTVDGRAPIWAKRHGLA